MSVGRWKGQCEHVGVGVGWRGGRVCVGVWGTTMYVVGENNERISQGIDHVSLPGSQTLTVLGEQCC